jgi:hypothetical protein
MTDGGCNSMTDLIYFILALLGIFGPLVLVWLIIEHQCGHVSFIRKKRLP